MVFIEYSSWIDSSDFTNYFLILSNGCGYFLVFNAGGISSIVSLSYIFVGSFIFLRSMLNLIVLRLKTSCLYKFTIIKAKFSYVLAIIRCLRVSLLYHIRQSTRKVCSRVVSALDDESIISSSLIKWYWTSPFHFFHYIISSLRYLLALVSPFIYYFLFSFVSN